jgi:hypothetical protein
MYCCEPKAVSEIACLIKSCKSKYHNQPHTFVFFPQNPKTETGWVGVVGQGSKINYLDGCHKVRTSTSSLPMSDFCDSLKGFCLGRSQ